jgi:spore coat protein U-like protein
MKLKFLTTALVVGALACGPYATVADAATYSTGTGTASMLVSLTLQGNCTISASPLNFGSSGVLSTAINQQTSVAVTCTNTTPYNVGLDGGSVNGSTVTNRLLAGTANGNTSTTVNFQLFQDSGHTTAWGTTPGTKTVGGTGTGSAQTIPVYGQIPAQATPRPDTYQTTVTATVYF